MITRMTRIVGFVLALFLPLAVFGCGGGGGGGGSLGGGIGGTGVRIGPVTQLGSIFVDDIQWDISQATISFNGNAGSEADIQVGMVAKVQGDITGSTGVALTVEVDEVIEGVVEAKIDASTFIVQGQMVQVDENTVYDDDISPKSLDGISIGDFLEIYGFVRGDGIILASRIDDESSLDELQVTGIVKTLDDVLKTFFIGGQKIDYTSADLSDLPGNEVVEGLLVRVEAQNTAGPGGELIAIEIETDDLSDVGDVDDIEVEGFVTEVLSPTQFLIGTNLIEITVDTEIKGGTVDDIVVGVFVEAEGATVSGTLFADEIEFGSSVEIESNIELLGADTFSLVGLPGLTVTTNLLTEYEGSASSFGDLFAGAHVRIRGRVIGAASVLATRVDLTSPDTDIEIQGPVDGTPAPADPVFSILGVAIDTTGIDDDDFETNELPGRATFFGTVLPGNLVEVQGTIGGGNVITWEEVDLEDDD